MIKLQYARPEATFWDQTMTDDLFGDIEGNIFVIPGEYEGEYIDRINEEINTYPYAIVLIMSDENSNFPLDKLSHPKMKVWLQYPKENELADHYLPAGYSPVRIEPKEKTLDWFWGGQVTHEDRYELVEQLHKMKNGHLIESKGFTQGIPLKDYLNIMATAKIVPCPRGNVSPDTMRMYDALELGCTPVIRARDESFFRKILPGFPFPVINDWSELPSVEYQDCRGWWNAHKNWMGRQMTEDVAWLRTL